MTRMGWNELPRTLRVALHDRLGQVCAATDLDVGQNNDLSVRLDRPGLPPVFCKGVHGGGRRGMFLNNEIATNSLVEGIAPAILCHVESGDWQVVAFEFVPGHPADLSPGSTDLTAVARVVDTLSTRSAGGSRPLRLRWHRTDWWRTLAESSPDIVRDCDVAELHRLATECPGQVDGDRLLHTDLHADQFVIVGSHVRVIDWAFPAAGAPWVDAAFVLIRLILAGHSMCEAEAWARELRCWATSSDQAVTAFAAYVAGMWSCWAARDPEPGAVRRARAARAYAAWRVGERVGNS